MGILHKIGSFLLGIWEQLKHFLIKVGAWLLELILDFTRHIKKFFENLRNRGKITRSTKALSIKIKELLKDEKNFSVVNIGLSQQSEDAILNVLYNEEKEEIVMEDSQLTEYQHLDDETKNLFAGKSILVIK